MEDFVPYELAVKLEQKGFKQGYNIFGFRPIFSDETTIKFISDIGAYENEYFGENITAPTISQVLKWLREEKNIHILPFMVNTEDVQYKLNIMGKLKNDISFRSLYNSLYEAVKTKTKTAYRSYEEAALAGIEYVIDNLI